MKKSFINKLFVCLLLFLSLMMFFSPFVNAEEETVPDIYSPSALLMDYSSGKILYEKNIYEKRYPASLTKIMTAIIVLENCNLSDIATVSYDAVMSLSSGYVTANLQVGEELTVEQLLYVLMVGSSNDAAIVLAEHVSGSVEEFANLMNQKAKELGCTSTNFVNPNGAHAENHYSTAYDLALIAKYAMQNDTFRTLVSTTSYSLPTTNKYDREDRIFRTTNALLQLDNSDRADNYYYKYATGIKTGFTTPAGNCLIASANKNDLELITVVLGSGQTESGLSQRYLDTLSLFNYGYKTYMLKDIANAGEIVQTVNVKGATKKTKKLNISVANDVYALIKQSDKNSSLLPEITLNENLKAPIKKGDIVGSVKYTVEGIDYAENLLADSDVKKSKFLLELIIFIIILLIVWSYIKNKRIKNKKKRLKNKYR